MTTEQFSLRWNNFHSNLTSGFHELLEAAEMVDVTLAVNGHFLQAHKIVLSICSPYFKQMFKDNPCKHPIVILKDVGHENMKDILEFMYMGEVSVLRENLTQFLRTAELLQVKGLTGDDSGEESPPKENKTDCDNEDENEIYNQLIETDVDIPNYSQSPPTHLAPVAKRTKHNNNSSTNTKRPKSENHQPQLNQLKPANQEFEPVKTKNELNNLNNGEETNIDNSNVSSTKPITEIDDCKEPINMKSIWDNSFGAAASTDFMNSSDQVNNFGQDWEVGHMNTITPYRAGTGEEINASISVKIGLRSVNVTLKNVTECNGVLAHEIINYNERFEWTWDQGRFGFGPYAGHLQQQFRAAQYRGLPLPILWIVDYFVIDGEGQRYGRFYRTAGWYSHIIMWSAFACWLLANILFRSVIHYGAYVLGLCGALQLFANLIFVVVQNPFPLSIPFDDGVLVTKFGFHFWCNFVMGLICLLLSAAILFMDYQYDELLYSFFGVNPLNSYDEVVYLTKEERMQLRPKKSSNDIPLVTLETGNKQEEEEDEDVDYVPVYLKRKTEVLAPKVNRYNKPSHLLS